LLSSGIWFGDLWLSAADISQAQFAKLIGVNLRTLQNWEQQRTRPTGAARALLKIVASNPKAALEALHQ
jgi:putative transcriptional regulator